jgi:hypothetical protein
MRCDVAQIPAPVFEAAVVDKQTLKFNRGWVGFLTQLYTMVKPIQNSGVYQNVVPTAGFTIVMSDNVMSLQLDPAGALAGTNVITLPGSLSSSGGLGTVDGSPVFIMSTQNITGLTIQSGVTGRTVSNAPTSLTAGIGVAFEFNGPKNKWYRRY